MFATSLVGVNNQDVLYLAIKFKEETDDMESYVSNFHKSVIQNWSERSACDQWSNLGRLLCYIWADKRGIFKSCPRVRKLRG